MKQSVTKTLAVLPLLLAVSACGPSGEALDKKLAHACESATKATFKGKDDTFEVTSSTFSTGKAFDNAPLRIVKLQGNYTQTATGSVEQKEYTCSYAVALMGQLPQFYSLESGQEKIGNFDGTITGDTELLFKIGIVTEQALNAPDDDSE